MNKIIVVLAAVGMLATACKKDRTCTCTVPASGAVPEQKFTYVMKDTKKKSAKNSCSIADEQYQLEGGSCELTK